MVRITTDDRGNGRFDTDRDASRSFVCRPRWRGRGVQIDCGYRARPAVVSVSAVSSHSLVGDVLLRDGSTLRLETPAPEDFGHIKAFYDGRSSESRYFRFHGYGRADTVGRSEDRAGGGAARARVRASRVRTSGRTGRHRPRGWLCARRARTPGRGDATRLGDRSRADATALPAAPLTPIARQARTRLAEFWPRLPTGPT